MIQLPRTLPDTRDQLAWLILTAMLDAMKARGFDHAASLVSEETVFDVCYALSLEYDMCENPTVGHKWIRACLIRSTRELGAIFKDTEIVELAGDAINVFPVQDGDPPSEDEWTEFCVSYRVAIETAKPR